MANTIDIKCGIYDTQATAVFHRDGTATIRAPYIKWVNNSGNLAFEKITISKPSHVQALRQIVAANGATGADEIGYSELISLSQYN